MHSDVAREVISIEIEALNALSARVGESFEMACSMMLACKGKVVVTGIGKSGLIGQKIAATLASTGTPSFFLHPAEGLHGDLGVLDKKDVVIAISNSGESDEVVRLLPIIKRMGLPLIAMVGKSVSSIGKASDVVLDVSVEKEACPFNLAPTASTTATLVMGDAIAVALIKLRGFSEEDFALRHPGGSLGKRLILTVSDMMHTGAALPFISDSVSMKDAIMEMTTKKLGVTGVLNTNDILIGIITDGDLRRALERHDDILSLPVTEIMTKNPKTIRSTDLAAKALAVMEERSITSLFVFDSEVPGRPIGIIHLHDLLKFGVV